ncbi:MAG: hydantoinase/carbamoylase family amidase [Burkholderiaceae bacterium]|nr:hydantoinase/carbamoylase family amidase [Burkholderiaceae bacterium]
MTLTFKKLNEATEQEFLLALDGVYGSASWLAESALAYRPYNTLTSLKLALVNAVRQAEPSQQLELIRAQPSVLSTIKQVDSGLVSELAELEATYASQFGFPFVLAVQGPRGTGLSLRETVQTLKRRLNNPVDFERQEALRNIHRIAEIRLNDKFGFEPVLGNQLWDWCEQLAVHSEPGYAERGELTVTYLTDAHRACAAQIAQLMRQECGFDEVQIDAVGNVVGIYHGIDKTAKRLITGSHYDTVRNGGKYDGRLGIFAPMLCVRELAKQKKRLPFGIEVVAFSEEEGQRYKAVFLGSGALTGEFNMDWLDQVDANGVSMRQAMGQAGLSIQDIGKLKRDASNYFGFVEVHIEQGPVLNELDLPLGVVTSINGSVRFVGEVRGMASHAGTTPMGMRRDAAAAVAELALYLEKRAASVPDLVGTMGMLEVPSGSVNVVPGRCRFSLDIRATTNEVRDACVADVKAELETICQRRGVQFELEEIMRAAAAPSAPEWQARWETAVKAQGLPVYRMPSGAGHDAMKMHNIMPQAMLFVRGLNSGISHNPLEMTTNDDAELSVRAFMHLLEQLAQA